MDTTLENILIKKKDGKISLPLLARNYDPWFYIQEDWELLINKGDRLIRNTNKNIEEERIIFGVNTVYSLMGVLVEIIAPLQITLPNPKKPYLKHYGRDSNNKKIMMDLRPGTLILGGHNSGFYDDYGVILEAHHTGGDPEKFEDWIYRVISLGVVTHKSVFNIILDNIHSIRSEPTSIIDLKLKSSKVIDDLIEEGERELFEYFACNPNKIVDLTPKQFEKLVTAIYKNLGFETEQIGSWNEKDHGVDIIAVSKTYALTEFRIAIQCKTSKNKISARPIRELAGVLNAFKANQGVVATTSKFTKPAECETDGHLWKISLQDRDELYKKIVSIL